MVRYLRHHRCSLPWVANRWANVFGFALALKRRWFATLGSEFFGVEGMDYFEEEMDF